MLFFSRSFLQSFIPDWFGCVEDGVGWGVVYGVGALVIGDRDLVRF